MSGIVLFNQDSLCHGNVILILSNSATVTSLAKQWMMKLLGPIWTLIINIEHCLLSFEILKQFNYDLIMLFCKISVIFDVSMYNVLFPKLINKRWHHVFFTGGLCITNYNATDIKIYVRICMYFWVNNQIAREKSTTPVLLLGLQKLWELLYIFIYRVHQKNAC